MYHTNSAICCMHACTKKHHRQNFTLFLYLRLLRVGICIYFVLLIWARLGTSLCPRLEFLIGWLAFYRDKGGGHQCCVGNSVQRGGRRGITPCCPLSGEIFINKMFLINLTKEWRGVKHLGTPSLRGSTQYLEGKKGY